MIGKTISHYRITEKLGQGGMGEVFLAQDTTLDRKVALKFLPDIFSGDPERLARFEREVRALAALSHPNILAIFDFGADAGVTYAVTELLEGETLRQRMDRERLAWRRSVEIAAAVADGLAAAHGKGIIHRDIKPENIFITADGRIKVLDFGLARIEEKSNKMEGATTLTDPGTAAGTVLGTVGYMAPEQVRGQAADARSDIFTLGCLLYEMLSGKRAFARETAAETMAAILKDPSPEVSESGVEATPELNRLVAHCLEKNPGERFQSASDLSFSLKHLVAATTTVPTDRQNAKTQPDVPSIAVLPFANLSPDPDQEYFCDGMAEEIMSDLSRIHSLRVISRTSVMAFKGTRKDLRTIAGQLKVRYVLEGSVRKAGNNLRITAQLIDAATDAHLWADKYTGALDDVFDMQEKVSRAITDALKLKLTPTEERHMTYRPVADIQAYDCYLRARNAIQQFTEEAIDDAVNLLKRGLTIVGDNALLFAGLGYAYYQYVNIGVRPEESAALAGEYANKALQLEPDTAQAHLVLGLYQQGYCGNPKSAILHYRQALSIDPNDYDSLFWLAVTYAIIGRDSLSLPLARRVLELDPLNPMSLFALPVTHLYAGRLGLAAELAKCEGILPALELPAMRYFLAYFLVYGRREQEALEVLEPFDTTDTKNLFVQVGIFLKNALLGNRARLTDCLTPDVARVASHDCQFASMLAAFWAMVDEKEKALFWAETAIRQGFINYPFLSEYDPFLSRLRSMPQFQKLLQRVKREWEEFGVQP